MADPRVGSDRNGFCIIGGHGRTVVLLLDDDGVGFPVSPAPIWRLRCGGMN